jgi:hypothetical protein
MSIVYNIHPREQTSASSPCADLLATSLYNIIIYIPAQHEDKRRLLENIGEVQVHKEYII